MARRDRLMSPAEANKNAHRETFCHKRLIEDNESTKCGEREGSASLKDEEVTCPRCNPSLLFKRA
jgi:DNA-directed RNA polymerase subunit RPC12/RpoP